MPSVKRIVMGSGIICEVQNDEMTCKVSDTSTMRNEAKYWLREKNVYETDANIDDVIQAMDEAGERKAEEIKGD